jgi:hypothetical protein
MRVLGVNENKKATDRLISKINTKSNFTLYNLFPITYSKRMLVLRILVKFSARQFFLRWLFITLCRVYCLLFRLAGWLACISVR